VAEAAMKSFNNIHANVADEKLETWNPPELGVDVSASVKDIQKGQVLSLFSNEADGADNKRNGQHSALHPMGTNQNFAAWQPVVINLQPAIVRKAVWNFLEVSDDSSDEQDQTKMANFFSGGAAQLDQFNPENEVPMMLDRARIQADEIILAAQAEADNVLLQAQSEIDEQKKEGYQQGRNDAHLELEDALKATQSMVEEVGAWKTSLIAQGEQILVEMLKEISRKMFGEGVELDKNSLQSNLSRIMESAHGLGSLNIFLNPKDARILDSSWVDQYLLISGGQAKIIPSDNITRGGCYVKGNMGTVDGRVETQLDAFLKSFDEVSTLAE
jgi:flagellar biosynthesis/type III secretory pathway protein FliH